MPRASRTSIELAIKKSMERPVVGRAADQLMAASLRLTTPVLKGFLRIGPRRLPHARQYLRRAGVYPLSDRYDQPLFDDAHLTEQPSRRLPGINWRHEKQVELLRALVPYGREFEQLLSQDEEAPFGFTLDNGSFESGDAEFLYGMVRHLRPRTVIEIGCGNSTRISRMALDRLAREHSHPSRLVCIEPYGVPWLESLDAEVIRSRVEEVDVSVFEQLEANDLLFIDSSHILRPQGDVLFEYFEILPRLKRGVHVHIHDIFSPRDYPTEWIHQDVRMWNEQYLVEALLSDSRRYDVVLALNYLKHSEYERMKSVSPHLTPSREPGSLYLRVREAD